MSEAYLALLGFIILMVGTPGPANLIVMLGGAQVGLRACLGFIAGLVCGKMLLNTLFGLGFGLYLAEQQWLAQTLKFASGGYMIWLAVRSWNDKPTSNDGDHQFDFRHGVIVHPLNPKAWVMVILAWSNFAPAIGAFEVQFIAVLTGFAMVQLLFHSAWCWSGQLLGHAMRGSRILTRSLIVLTVAVVIWALVI